MDSIFKILENKHYDEPPEIELIKQFVLKEYGQTVGVLVREKDILIQVSSAALANTLRLRQIEIKRQAGTEKRLNFRIVA
ncbi:MAG TPA: hypothetical protein VFN51_02290 [Candidatus Saccharimonadales bacterium]|nr:hypothetical protein [Candidatus Saccharimonadales bacterium]